MTIQAYVLENKQGDRVEILNWGARLHRWMTSVCGQPRDLLVGYDDIQQYQDDPCYLGAVVGPFANRIGQGKTRIGSDDIQLQTDDNHQHLHGGATGLHHKAWQVIQHSAQSLTLTTTFADGEAGYPGPIVFEVNYQLRDHSELLCSINATSSTATLVGPTLHPYFNLNTDQSAGIEGHHLIIYADHFTPVDESNIPNGNIYSLTGTALDYRQGQSLTSYPGDQDVDLNYVLQRKNGKPDAMVISPDKAVALSVFSDYPGMQFYTGHHLGAPFTPKQGFCLEPQFFPDAPNKPHFPFELTTPEQPFKKYIRYRLKKNSYHHPS